eukprot:CAMPEP_0175043500 /NCGR_PEP_ID=MMETSP0052_2-20121109/3226_1 /TAXON_ID=51329 ORGANISM="Polytomella parva, Strain SAG 63-3" /NCGR_SAMPLE_ID=MMETSP0052_2 /ASSEMBLY_ACC=CAM_ASM_000194 /LENGTH=389 /DNA_ID=CAMNT_0016306575 /DNA_START=376 /DNA_END=1542 /DNA_ORIENTATION=+
MHVCSNPDPWIPFRRDPKVAQTTAKDERAPRNHVEDGEGEETRREQEFREHLMAAAVVPSAINTRFRDLVTAKRRLAVSRKGVQGSGTGAVADRDSDPKEMTKEMTKAIDSFSKPVVVIADPDGNHLISPPSSVSRHDRTGKDVNEGLLEKGLPTTSTSTSTSTSTATTTSTSTIATITAATTTTVPVESSSFPFSSLPFSSPTFVSPIFPWVAPLNAGQQLHPTAAATAVDRRLINGRSAAGQRPDPVISLRSFALPEFLFSLRGGERSESLSLSISSPSVYLPSPPPSVETTIRLPIPEEFEEALQYFRKVGSNHDAILQYPPARSRLRGIVSAARVLSKIALGCENAADPSIPLPSYRPITSSAAAVAHRSSRLLMISEISSHCAT